MGYYPSEATQGSGYLPLILRNGKDDKILASPYTLLKSLAILKFLSDYSHLQLKKKSKSALLLLSYYWSSPGTLNAALQHAL